VRFAGLQRDIAQPYSTVSSERLHEVLMREAESNPNLDVRLATKVSRVVPEQVEIAGDETLQASVVVDARGPEHAPDSSVIGFQKFLGVEYEVEPASNLTNPLLMDAIVEQTDGYRFFYVLPLAADRVLVEDTYYSDTPELDVERLRGTVADYARSQSLRVSRVLREEVGVLPLPAHIEHARPVDRRHLVAGYAGGWFHPTTGYSFPPALRLAQQIANSEPETLESNVGRLLSETVRQQKYCVLLNRLLFDGFDPSKRAPVFERFYRMPLSTIVHFYALQMSAGDRARLLCGKPPPGINPMRAFSRFARRRQTGAQGGTA
jgi:lycopene beta-cyclase